MAESIVQSALEWIASLLLRETSALFEVEDQVQSLKEKLQVLQGYLRGAETEQQAGAVQALTSQITNLAYDAEDVIDTYVLKVEAKANEQRYRNWFMKFACFLRSAPHIYQVGKQIEKIQSRLKHITDDLDSFGVRRVNEPGERLRSSSCNKGHSKKKPQSYPHDEEGEYIVGLEDDILKLKEILMGEGHHRTNIVSIVGMGGSGKTTLARKLYNHPYSKECFDCCAWVFISQKWSTTHVLFEILRKVGGRKGTTKLNAESRKEELIDKLRDILKKKSYLVVLDDVWSKEALEEILPALPRVNNKKGSKIIITTRNKDVLHQQKNLYVHKAEPLSEADAWNLFKKIALDCRTYSNIQSFENLGKEMLKKCDGLPLAIIALAGILSTKESIAQWQQVNEAVRSRVMESTEQRMSIKIGDLLALSYDDLPYYLKHCFLYLGVFPEDCQIATGMLTRMWIAEGLIATHREMSLEDVAMLRLEELSHRFMIQVVRANFKGEIKAIRLHDLLRDLCVAKANEQSFLEIYTPKLPNFDARATIIQPRRAALHSSLSFPTHVPHLRSLVLLTRSSILHSAYVYKETVALEDISNRFKMLRVLNIWGIQTTTRTLPSQIGSLIHLRYLGIRETNITELPTSIGRLRNLLTLDYRNVESDDDIPIRIPSDLVKLALLRHLFLPVECLWGIEDLHLSNLENLQILWGIKQHGTSNWLSRRVTELSTSIKKLKIVVSTKEELDATFCCPSLVDDKLHTFHCEMTHDVTLQLEHMELFSHCDHMHKLILIGKIKEELALILPKHLAVLHLKDSMLKDVDPMVALGRLHLKLLMLSNAYCGTIFTCTSDSFPELEELYLDGLSNLDTWRIEKGAFPCLKKLEITCCGKLQDFPEGLASITTLQQLEFYEMPTGFSQKAIEHGWSQKSRRLPHNWEAIIKLCDSRIDASSIQKLYEELVAGVFLSNRTKKYWVMKQADRYRNCFMVYATSFSLATEVDRIDGIPLPVWDMGRDDHWEWSRMTESDGTMIKVAKLKSERPFFKVRGSFNVEYLSPEITYRVVFVVMLDDSFSGEDTSVKTVLKFPGQDQEHCSKLDEKPRNDWLQIVGGEFDTSPDDSGEVEFTLDCEPRYQKGFTIKGVLIEPKLEASK